MTYTIDEWFAGGERLVVPLPTRTPGSARAGESSEYSIFCRVEGSGPWLTFLHGFPTCSWDWAKVQPALSSGFRLLMFDFLGFGDSDKPANHAYSLMEQADLVAALWKRFSVAETGIVAHDYGSTVAVELIGRQAAGSLSTRIRGAVLLNAGLYVDLQRPVLAQRLLQKPIAGPLLSRFIGETFFSQQFASVFSESYPPDKAELGQFWSAIVRHKGVRNYHRLIYYLTERQLNKARWERTLEASPVPLHFVWGLADPVSGRNISDHIREFIPDASLLELPDIGHYPQLEAPEIVAREIHAFFNSKKD